MYFYYNLTANHVILLLRMKLLFHFIFIILLFLHTSACYELLFQTTQLICILSTRK